MFGIRVGREDGRGSGVKGRGEREEDGRGRREEGEERALIAGGEGRRGVKGERGREMDRGDRDSVYIRKRRQSWSERGLQNEAKERRKLSKRTNTLPPTPLLYSTPPSSSFLLLESQSSIRIYPYPGLQLYTNSILLRDVENPDFFWTSPNDGLSQLLLIPPARFRR